MCVYLWVMPSVSLIYVSVFLLIPYCFDYCSFVLVCVKDKLVLAKHICHLPLQGLNPELL